MEGALLADNRRRLVDSCGHLILSVCRTDPPPVPLTDAPPPLTGTGRNGKRGDSGRGCLGGGGWGAARNLDPSITEGSGPLTKVYGCGIQV